MTTGPDVIFFTREHESHTAEFSQEALALLSVDSETRQETEISDVPVRTERNVEEKTSTIGKPQTDENHGRICPRDSKSVIGIPHKLQKAELQPSSCMAGQQQSFSQPPLSLRVENEIPCVATSPHKPETPPAKGVVSAELECKLPIENSSGSRAALSTCNIEQGAALIKGKESLDSSTKSKQTQKPQRQRMNPIPVREKLLTPIRNDVSSIVRKHSPSLSAKVRTLIQEGKGTGRVDLPNPTYSIGSMKNGEISWDPPYTAEELELPAIRSPRTCVSPSPKYTDSLTQAYEKSLTLNSLSFQGNQVQQTSLWNTYCHGSEFAKNPSEAYKKTRYDAAVSAARLAGEVYPNLPTPPKPHQDSSRAWMHSLEEKANRPKSHQKGVCSCPNWQSANKCPAVQKGGGKCSTQIRELAASKEAASAPMTGCDMFKKLEEPPFIISPDISQSRCLFVNLLKLMKDMAQKAYGIATLDWDPTLSAYARENLALSLKETSENKLFLCKELQPFLDTAKKWLTQAREFTANVTKAETYSLHNQASRTLMLQKFWKLITTLPNFTRIHVMECAYLIAIEYSADFYVSLWSYGRLKHSTQGQYSTAFRFLSKIMDTEEDLLILHILEGKIQPNTMLCKLYAQLQFRDKSTSWCTQATSALGSRFHEMGVDLKKVWPNFSKQSQALMKRFAKSVKTHGNPFNDHLFRDALRLLTETGNLQDLYIAIIATLLAVSALRQERFRIAKWNHLQKSTDGWILWQIEGNKHARPGEVQAVRLPARLAATEEFDFSFLFRLLRTLNPSSPWLFPRMACLDRSMSSQNFNKTFMAPFNVKLEQVEHWRRASTPHNFRSYSAYVCKKWYKFSQLQTSAILFHKLSKKKFPALTTNRYVMTGSDHEQLRTGIANWTAGINLKSILTAHPRWEELFKLHKKHPTSFNIPFQTQSVNKICATFSERLPRQDLR